MRRTHNSLEDQERNSAPLVEIFGGLFALLMVLFLLFNLFSQAALLERLETTSDEGLYRIGWGAHGAGYVVIAFPEELRIIETGESVKRGEICKPGSPFIPYALKTYNTARNQLIFALLEGSVATMAEARNCTIQVLPGRVLSIGWIVADSEVLKSVSLNDIPPYIEKVIKP